MTRKPPPIEAKAEEKFCRMVKARGGIVRKMNGLGFRSWPDRLVIGPYGVHLMIEFKRVGFGLTPLQESLHRELKKLGQQVFVFYTAEDAIAEYERQVQVAARGVVKSDCGPMSLCQFTI